jgi:cation diffusion facilitator CzcD-associated flavoprotein CzcO
MLHVVDLPNVCVIGAGCSGLTATKALSEAGIAVDCFERSERIGGLWAYRDGDGKTAAYRSLHINTSRNRMAFSDMQADIDREREAMFARYVKSRRHTMQVDFDDYLLALSKERRRGAKRARKRGHTPSALASGHERAVAGSS